ncbi:MAG: SDR family NAD(P)-dependent oxidoreductase, partial [Clostridia bacterium]|nr:SDR family NAD(P)-dependent oxidoreductase [Clostridia bacterium]
MKDTVLVTGASGGLGLELARLFAKDGCDVILTARSEPKLREIAAQFAADYGVTATPIAADLSQPDGVDALMAAVNGRGFTVDVLVNNAGFGDFGPFAEC